MERLYYIVMLIIVLITLFAFGFICFSGYMNETVEHITIEEKYIKRTNESDRYMISADDGETYKITDLFFKGKFNSADIYAELKVGHRYKVYVTGYRFPLFSEFRNINKIIEEVVE